MTSNLISSPARALVVLALTLSATLFTSAAHAQICLGGIDTRRFERASELDRSNVTPLQLHKAGVAALQAGAFATADLNFTALVGKQPRNADANFLLGLAKFGQQDWPAARTYLEIASNRDSRRPEPRTRLGMTLIQLGDLNAATEVFDQLKELDARCKDRCKDDEWIKAGIVELGGALTAALEAPRPAD